MEYIEDVVLILYQFFPGKNGKETVSSLGKVCLPEGELGSAHKRSLLNPYILVAHLVKYPLPDLSGKLTSEGYQLKLPEIHNVNGIDTATGFNSFRCFRRACREHLKLVNPDQGIAAVVVCQSKVTEECGIVAGNYLKLWR